MNYTYILSITEKQGVDILLECDYFALIKLNSDLNLPSCIKDL